MPSLFLQHRHRTEYSTSFFQDLLFYLIEWVMPYKSILCLVSSPYHTVVLPQDFQQIALPFAWPWTHTFSQTSLQSLDPAASYFNTIIGWWILSDPSGHNQRHVKQTDYSAGQWSIWQAPTVDRCCPAPEVCWCISRYTLQVNLPSHKIYTPLSTLSSATCNEDCIHSLGYPR